MAKGPRLIPALARVKNFYYKQRFELKSAQWVLVEAGRGLSEQINEWLDQTGHKLERADSPRVTAMDSPDGESRHVIYVQTVTYIPSLEETTDEDDSPPSIVQMSDG